MAATRFIALHMNKGRSAAQTLNDRADYVKDHLKTEDGKYVSAYGCNPESMAEEFLLSRQQYQHRFRRQYEGEILAYQIRQSFKPGEITPEEANQVGYETAMRFTKGHYAFIVCTHTDRAHIHNHIIYNSVSMDGGRKFRNFFLSGKALQRLSDMICLEHGLSVITPAPRWEQKKRTEYPSRNTVRDELRKAIDAVLERKPKDLDELLRMLEDSGVEVKRRKQISLRTKNAQRFIRLKTLGTGYSQTELEEYLRGEGSRPDRNRAAISRKNSRFNMLIDVNRKISEGKGNGYVRWAQLYNVHQVAAVLLFLQEKNITTMPKLRKETADAQAAFDRISGNIKEVESEMERLKVLRQSIFAYADARKVYEDYRRHGYSRKFYAEHQEDIDRHKAAKKAFSDLQVSKIPKVKEINKQYQELYQQKQTLYAEYKEERHRLKELQDAEKIVKEVLRENDEQETKEKAREKQTR